MEITLVKFLNQGNIDMVNPHVPQVTSLELQRPHLTLVTRMGPMVTSLNRKVTSLGPKVTLNGPKMTTFGLHWAPVRSFNSP